jgi:hypothetical protein
LYERCMYFIRLVEFKRSPEFTDTCWRFFYGMLLLAAYVSESAHLEPSHNTYHMPDLRMS